MTKTAQGHAELVERVIDAIRAADEAWFLDRYPETPAEKLRQWTAELHDNFRAVAEAAIAATLSAPIAAHGAGAVTEGDHVWPAELMIRDTKLYDDMGGAGQRIYTTAGQGYEKRKYIRADLSTPIAAHGTGAVTEASDRAENTTDNPKSWIAWKRRALAAEATIDASENNPTYREVSKYWKVRARAAERELEERRRKEDTFLRPDEAAGQGESTTGRVKVPEGQTPLNYDLHHPLMDAFNAGSKARDTGGVSPYHGHSLEHLLHACGWVQRDLRLALDAARNAPSATPRPEASDAPDIVPVAWRDPATAPKDGTMLQLLIQRGDVDRGAWSPFEDSLDPYVTIGFNNLANTLEDEWEFAGWDWSHDCFTTGYGEVVGWLPFGPDALAALRAELATVTQKAERYLREAGAHFAKSCEYAEAREAAEAEVARLKAELAARSLTEGRDV